MNEEKALTAEILNPNQVMRAVDQTLIVSKSLKKLMKFLSKKQKKDLDTGDVVELMILLRNLRDSSKDGKAAIQNIYDAFSIGVVPEFLEEQGLDSATGNGHRLEIRDGLRVSCPAKNKEALCNWLKEHELSGMIGSTINSSSLKSMVKSALEDQTDYPGELLKIEPYKQAVIVKK